MSHTRPLGGPAVGDPTPIPRIEPMPAERALDIAMQGLQDIEKVLGILVEWLGISDTGLRYRRVELIAALSQLHMLRARLRRERGEDTIHD